MLTTLAHQRHHTCTPTRHKSFTPLLSHHTPPLTTSHTQGIADELAELREALSTYSLPSSYGPSPPDYTLPHHTFSSSLVGAHSPQSPPRTTQCSMVQPSHVVGHSPHSPLRTTQCSTVQQPSFVGVHSSHSPPRTSQHSMVQRSTPHRSPVQRSLAFVSSGSMGGMSHAESMQSLQQVRHSFVLSEAHSAAMLHSLHTRMYAHTHKHTQHITGPRWRAHALRSRHAPAAAQPS